MKEIRLSFDKLGHSKIDAEGFIGNSCEDATAAYVTALNAKSTDDTKKPEFYASPGVDAKVGSRW